MTVRYFKDAGDGFYIADIADFDDVEDAPSWLADKTEISKAEYDAAHPAPPAPTPENTPPAVPSEISDRQFFQQLAIMGLISEDEAIAAVSTGALPPVMAGFIDQLPANERFAARMALQGATTFIRSNPLVETFGTMQGMTSSEIDELWRSAAAL